MALVIQEVELRAIGKQLRMSFFTGIVRLLIHEGPGAREGTSNPYVLPDQCLAGLLFHHATQRVQVLIPFTWSCQKE